MPNWSDPESVRRWIEEQQRKQQKISTSDILRGPYNPPVSSTSDILREREIYERLSRLSKDVSSITGHPRPADEFSTRLSELNAQANQLASSWRSTWEQYRKEEREDYRKSKPNKELLESIQLPWEPQQLQMMRPDMPDFSEIRPSGVLGSQTVSTQPSKIRQTDVYTTQLDELRNKTAAQIQQNLLQQQIRDYTFNAPKSLPELGGLRRPPPVYSPSTQTLPEAGGYPDSEYTLAVKGKLDMAGERFGTDLALEKWAKEQNLSPYLIEGAKFLEKFSEPGIQLLGGIGEYLDIPNAVWRTIPIPGSAKFYGLEQDVTIGQQIQAFGEYFSKMAFNFDIEKDEEQKQQKAEAIANGSSYSNAVAPPNIEWAKGLESIWSAIQVAFDPSKSGNYMDWAQQHLNAGNEVRSAIIAAYKTNPEIGERLLPGLTLLTTSGPQRAENFIQSVEHQWDMVSHYIKAGQQALANGDVQTASKFFAAANEEREKTPTDYYDENASIAGELMWGLTFDWMNLPIFDVLKLTPGARKASKFLKTVEEIEKLPEQQAADLVAQAFKHGTEQLKLVTETAQQAITSGQQTIKESSNFLKKITQTVSSLFERTPETKAHWMTDNAFQAFGQLINGISDKATIRSLINWMLDDPAKLITGLLPEDIPGSSITAAGKFKVSPAIFLTEQGKEAAKVLAAAGDALRNMETLQGDGVITDLKLFMGELDNILWSTAQKLAGLDPLPFIPNGTVSIRVVKAAKNSPLRVIEYLDDAGNVIQRTEPMTGVVAKRIKDQYYRLASAGSRITDFGKELWNAQRTILADVYLHTRPAHWLRNAVTAFATLMADSNLTLEPIADIYAYLSKKAGDAIQTPRILSSVTGGERGLGEGIQSMVGQGEHWTRKFWPQYNPIAAIVEKGSKVWTTTTHVPLTGERIPFGENAFYVRAFAKVMQRFWNQHWPEEVQKVASSLMDANIQSDLVRGIIDTFVQAGKNGNRQDILNTVETLLKNHYAPVNLAEAGLQPGLFAPETWQKLWGAVQDIDPARMTREQIESIIRRAVADDVDNWLKVLVSTPPQQGRITFTSSDITKDAATMIEIIKTDAIRSGLSLEEAQKMAFAAGRTYTEQLQNLLNELVDLSKTVQPTPQTTQLVGSSLLEIHRIMEEARSQVDALYSLVNMNQISWTEKFNRTQAIYARIPQTIQKEIERVKELLPRAQAGESIMTLDWSDVLSKLIQYDDTAVQRMMERGLKLRSAATSPEYKAVIDAGRSYVDHSLTTLYLAMMRFPTIESLDIIADALRSVNSIGVQARAMQADALEKLLNNVITIDDYYRIRNEIWHGMFLEQGTSVLAYARKILADGFQIQNPITIKEATEAADAALAAMPSAQEAIRIADDLDIAIAETNHIISGTIPPGYTIPVRDRQYVRQAIKDTFGYTEQQTDDLMAIMDARASVYARITGKTPDAWYADKIAEIRKAQPSDMANLLQQPRGGVRFLDDNRAVILAFENPDISTFVHEIGHVFRRDLEDIGKIDPSALEDLRRAEEALGVKNGIWTKAAEEAFARAWERYLASGKAPIKDLQNIFERFKTWLTQLWQNIKDYPKINVSKELKSVFDRMLADMPQTLTTKQANELRRLAAAAGIATDKGDWHLINAIAKDLRAKGIEIPEKNWAATLKRIDNLPFSYYENAIQILNNRISKLQGAVEEVSLVAKGVNPDVPETKPIVETPQPEATPTVAQLDDAKQAQKVDTEPDFTGERRPSDVEPDTEGGGSGEPPFGGAGTSGEISESESPRTITGAAEATELTNETTFGSKPAAEYVPKDAKPLVSDPSVYEDTNGVRYLSYNRLPKPMQFVTPEKLQEVLNKTGGKWTFLEHQVDNADRALSAFYQKKGFVIADATGTGKTYSGALIFDLMFDQGAKKILLVAPNDGILKQWESVLNDIGINVHRSKKLFVAASGERTITATTYAAMRSWDIDKLFSRNRWDLVVFDESHYMKNLMIGGSEQAKVGDSLVKYADNVLYLSATPLESVLHYGYMVNGLRIDKTFQQAMNTLGIYKQFDKKLKRDVWRGLSPQKLAQLHYRLASSGVYVRHEMSYKSIYNKTTGQLLNLYSSAVRVPVSEMGAQQYKALNQALDHALRITGMKAYKQIQAIRVNWGKALLEQEKLPVAIEIAKRKLAEGKSVAFFLFRKSAADYETLISNVKDKTLGQEMEIVYRLLQEYGVQIQSPVEILLKAFPDAVKITGDEAAGTVLRQKNVEAFQKGESRIAIVTMSAGGTGLSLHDTIGKFPRVQINLTSPYTAMMMEQVAGRTFRMGSQSNAELYWLFNDLPLENVYARRVMTRMKEMGAMVRGDESLASTDDMLEFIFRDAESGSITEIPNDIHVSQSILDLEDILTPPWEKPGYTPQYSPNFKPSTTASIEPSSSDKFFKPTSLPSNRVAGKTIQAWSDPQQKYTLQYEVVELDDLNTSSLISGAPNPNYPAELQPRDRSQLASREQIARMAQFFEPLELLSDTNAIDRGPVIIANRYDVVSGNGRTLAMKQLSDAQYANYHKLLIENASKYGFTPEQIESFKKPVLVRRLSPNVDPVKFAIQANTATTLQMNTIEQAKILAKTFRASDFVYFDMGSADNLRQALSMTSNTDFLQRVMARIPDNQRAALIDSNGYLTTQGVDLIRAALFSVVFDNDYVLRNYILSPTPELANIGNGLEMAIVNLAHVHLQRPDLSLGENIAQAATELIQLKAQGMSIEERLAQLGMFEQIPKETQLLLEFFENSKRSAKKIGQTLNQYARLALNQQFGQDLFGETGVSKLELLEAVLRNQQTTLYQPESWITAFKTRLRFKMPDLTGMTGDPIDNWYDLIDWSDRAKRISGNVAPPLIGNGTAQSIADVENAIMKLTDYLIAGRKPNTLTPQQAEAIRQMAQQLLPAYDKINTAATKTAEAAANFAMLNFRDRRKIDSLMSIIFPFHFFWSRSAGNWLQRMATNTRLLNAYYELNRAVELENKQSNVPAYLKGTIPIPNTDWRIPNPLFYMLPINTYFGSDFYDPSEAQTPLEAAYLYYRKYTPAAMPGIDILANFILDRMSPREGKPRMGQYQAVDWMPLGKIAGLAYQAATGAMPRKGFWSWDDEYSFGRIGKQIALDVIAGKADKQLALWGLDNIHQYINGVGPLPEDPGQAEALIQSAAKTVGANRLATSIGAFLAFPIYLLSPEERQARMMRQQRRALAFSPQQYWGSRQIIEKFDEQTGEVLKPYSVYYQLYPSSEADEHIRPGIIAAAAAKRAETQPIFAEMQTAVDAAIQANPDITPKELWQIKAPYWEKIEEIKQKYPSLGGDYTPRPPYGANPQERAEWELRNLIEMTKPAGRPTWPGDDATKEELKEYYTSLANWKEAHYKALEEAIIDQQQVWDDQKIQAPWRIEFDILIKGEPADLVRRYDDLFFASEVEKRWADYTARYQQWNREQWQARRENVIQVLGKEVADLTDAYLQLEQSSEERKLMKEQNPILDFALLVAFNPGDYQVATEIFGEDLIRKFFDAKAERPQWPGTDATQQELQAYYNARDKFFEKYPWYEEIDMYLYGRPSLNVELPEDVQQAYYDFGKDWKEAKEIFGDNIFDLYVQANIAPSYKEWLKKHPQEALLVIGYTEFRKAQQQVALVEKPIVRPSQFALDTEPIAASFIPGQEPSAKPVDVPPGVYRLPGTPGATGTRPLPEQLQQTKPLTEEQKLTPSSAQSTNVPTKDDELKTAFDWAMQNEKFAVWEGRKQAIAAKFGSENRILYEKYLMSSPSEREKMRQSNPILKVIGIYTYHPDKYAEATELFGDVWAQWAAAPPYDGTQTSLDLRAEYWRQHPEARELHIWLYGRYKGHRDPINDETFSYDFGKDWNYAKEHFGEDIWRIYINYNSKWDKQTKRAYFNAHPTFSDFLKWWNEYDETPVLRINMWEGYPFGGGRRWSGGGKGRGSGGGGGGGGSSQDRYSPSIYVRPREMEADLRMPIGAIRPWRVNWYGNPPDLNLLKFPATLRWKRNWG